MDQMLEAVKFIREKTKTLNLGLILCDFFFVVFCLKLRGDVVVLLLMHVGSEFYYQIDQV